MKRDRHIITTVDPVKPGHTIQRTSSPSRLTWSAVVMLLDLTKNQWHTNPDLCAAFDCDEAEARHLTRIMFDAGILERTRTPGTRFGFSYRLIQQL